MVVGSSMDYTKQTAQDVQHSNGKPPTDAFEPTDDDLKNLFVKQQIVTWGWEQVEDWFKDGFDLVVVKGKVLWVK